jgi:hypothetical protein
LIFVEH